MRCVICFSPAEKLTTRRTAARVAAKVTAIVKGLRIIAAGSTVRQREGSRRANTAVRRGRSPDGRGGGRLVYHASLMSSQFQLLRERRFRPLFFTQFLGAFNDNVFKTALITLVTFRAG